MSTKLVMFLVLLLVSLFAARGMTTAQSNEDVAFWEMDVPPDGGWKVGDQIQLRLRVITSDDAEVVLPNLEDQWGVFEIREQAPVEVEINSEQKTTIKNITVQLWRVGEYETPPTILTIIKGKEESYEIEARPLLVNINSVLPTDVDETSIEKRDLKPQADLPKPPVWPWLLAAICAAPMMVLAGRWFWSKLKKHRTPVVTELTEKLTDNRLPEEIAYGCLDRILGMDLPSIGAFKQHYTMVTDCIRTYLLGVYDVPAMDLTTTELRRALRNKKIDSESLSLLWELLDQADYVKFAKYQPDTAHARGIVNWGRHFIDCTKPSRFDDTVVVKRDA